MLYNFFRESIKETELTITQLIRFSTPSPDEWTEDAKTYITQMHETKVFLGDALTKLPEKLEGYEDNIFGPRIQQDDILFILSKLAPLAADINFSKALYSYNPAQLYKLGTHFVTSTIEFYWGWQKYNLGEHKTLEGEVNNFFDKTIESGTTNINLNDFLTSLDGFKKSLIKGANWDFGNDFNQI